jgi:hypothetical protein
VQRFNQSKTTTTTIIITTATTTTTTTTTTKILGGGRAEVRDDDTRGITCGDIRGMRFGLGCLLSTETSQDT